MDRLRRGGGRMVAGYADARSVGGQCGERRVDLLDRRLLAARILRVARLVDALVVHVDEGVAGVEVVGDEPHFELCGNRLEPDTPPEAAQERRLGREGAVDSVPLAKARQRPRPPEPL